MLTRIQIEGSSVHLIDWGLATLMARTRKVEREPQLWVCQVRLPDGWHWVTRTEKAPGAYDPIVNPVARTLWVERAVAR